MDCVEEMEEHFDSINPGMNKFMEEIEKATDTNDEVWVNLKTWQNSSLFCVRLKHDTSMEPGFQSMEVAVKAIIDGFFPFA